MNKEQAIAVLKNEMRLCEPYVKKKLYGEELTYEALDFAVKALEHPSDDCVSRAEVLNQLKEWRDCEFVKMTNPYHYLEKRIQSMSPVTPTFPKGATNGDMLTTLFGEKALITLDTHNYLKKWWDAPYERM